MTMTIKEAAFYQAGEQARLEKKPRELNPYSKHANAVFFAFWDAGWCDKDTELKAELRWAMDFGGSESDCAY